MTWREREPLQETLGGVLGRFASQEGFGRSLQGSSDLQLGTWVGPWLGTCGHLLETLGGPLRETCDHSAAVHGVLEVHGGLLKDEV